MSMLKPNKEELLEWLDDQIKFHETAPYGNEYCLPYYRKIAAIIKNQPTITNEWIIESAENIAADYPEVAFPNLIAIFKGLLTEAGVSITVDPHRKSGK